VEENEQKSVKVNNVFGLTGFILALCSLFFGGILAIVAIIFSSLGIHKFDAKINKNKWQGVTGLILSILFIIFLLLLNMFR